MVGLMEERNDGLLVSGCLGKRGGVGMGMGGWDTYECGFKT